MRGKLLSIIICGLMIIHVIPSINVSKLETKVDGAIMWYGHESRLVCIQLSSDGQTAKFTESTLLQESGDPMPSNTFTSLTMLHDGSLILGTITGNSWPFVSKLYHIKSPQCDGSTSYAKLLGTMPDQIGIEALYTDASNRIYAMDTGEQVSSREGNRLLRFTGDVLNGDFQFEVITDLSLSVPDIDGLGPGINKTDGRVVDTPGFAMDTYDVYNVDYVTGTFSYVGSSDGVYAIHAINGSWFSDGKSRLYTISGIPQAGEKLSTLYEINPDTGKTLHTLGSGPSGTGLTGPLPPGPSDFPDLKEPPVADAGPDQTVNEGDTVQFDGSASYDPDGDPEVWVLKVDIPSPTWGCGATVLNGEIYYMGGIPCYPIVNPSSVFMKYDPATDSWLNLIDLPAPRSYLGAAAVSGKIYAIGGSNGNESTDKVFEFDPTTNIWATKSPMPNPMEAFGIAVVKDRIYVIGGSSTWLSNESCMSVYEYDPVNDIWSVKSDMPTGRSNLACAVLEDKIYAIGGNVYGPIGAVEVYDPSAETWTKKANISIPRSGLCAEALGGNIYAFGGTNVWALPTNMTETYDPSSDSWTIGPSMREPRVYFGSGVVGSCIYAMGGSYGPLIVDLPNSTEEYCVGDGLVYEWDFDALVDSDGDSITTNDIDATGPTPTHVYGDNGIFNVTLRVTDDQNLMDTDTCNITVLNVDPIIDPIQEYTINEFESVTLIGHATDPGSDDLTFTWNWGYVSWGDKTTTYYNDGLSPDPYPSPEINPRNIIEEATNQYGDDGVFTVTLTVSDDDGGSTIVSTKVTVNNIDPIATIKSAIMDVEISLRVAGSKWSNIGLTLYENDIKVGYLEVERWPGNPDDNPTYENPALPTKLDMTKSYKAIVTYDPYPDNNDEIKGDQPNNGKDKQNNAGNPVWIIMKFGDGGEEKIHHTFNTQQSKKKNSEHWNHIEPWELDLNVHLIGHLFVITSHITDPGSDDETLTYIYGSQTVSVTNLNDPPNLDPYPSPEVQPMDTMDTTTLVYEGVGTITLIVKDDDNIRLGIGQGTDSISIL